MAAAANRAIPTSSSSSSSPPPPHYCCDGAECCANGNKRRRKTGFRDVPATAAATWSSSSSCVDPTTDRDDASSNSADKASDAFVLRLHRELTVLLGHTSNTSVAREDNGIGFSMSQGGSREQHQHQLPLLQLLPRAYHCLGEILLFADSGGASVTSTATGRRPEQQQHKQEHEQQQQQVEEEVHGMLLLLLGRSLWQFSEENDVLAKTNMRQKQKDVPTPLQWMVLPCRLLQVLYGKSPLLQRKTSTKECFAEAFHLVVRCVDVLQLQLHRVVPEEEEAAETEAKRRQQQQQQQQQLVYSTFVDLLRQLAPYVMLCTSLCNGDETTFLHQECQVERSTCLSLLRTVSMTTHGDVDRKTSVGGAIRRHVVDVLGQLARKRPNCKRKANGCRDDSCYGKHDCRLVVPGSEAVTPAHAAVGYAAIALQVLQSSCASKSCEDELLYFGNLDVGDASTFTNWDLFRFHCTLLLFNNTSLDHQSARIEGKICSILTEVEVKCANDHSNECRTIQVAECFSELLQRYSENCGLSFITESYDRVVNRALQIFSDNGVELAVKRALVLGLEAVPQPWLEHWVVKTQTNDHQQLISSLVQIILDNKEREEAVLRTRYHNPVAEISSTVVFLRMTTILLHLSHYRNSSSTTTTAVYRCELLRICSVLLEESEEAGVVYRVAEFLCESNVFESITASAEDPDNNSSGCYGAYHRIVASLVALLARPNLVFDPLRRRILNLCLTLSSCRHNNSLLVSSHGVLEVLVAISNHPDRITGEMEGADEGYRTEMRCGAIQTLLNLSKHVLNRRILAKQSGLLVGLIRFARECDEKMEGTDTVEEMELLDRDAIKSRILLVASVL